jgi:hypothetical protein
MPNYDLVSAWRFVESEITNAENVASTSLAAYKSDRTIPKYEKVYEDVSDYIYNRYEKYRRTGTKRGFNTASILRVFRSQHVGWTLEEKGNNLYFYSGRKDIHGATSTRLSIQLSALSIQYIPNDLVAVSQGMCKSAEKILGTNASAEIFWKFVDKKSIGGRIDDIVVYIIAVGSDDIADSMGKDLSLTLSGYLESSTWGVPGAVKIRDGVYYAGECLSSTTTWWSPSLKDNITIPKESHGGSLGGSGAIAILDSNSKAGRAYLFKKAFANYRSGHVRISPLALRMLS